MPRRTHLRTRVLLITCAFAVALFAITFGLSVRAKRSQERWSRLIGVETRAIAALEDLVRAQHAYYAHLTVPEGQSQPEPWPVVERLQRYRVVQQILRTEPLAAIDITLLRGRVKAFADMLEAPDARPEDLANTSALLVREAERMLEQRKRGIDRTLPELEHDTDAMMRSGLGVAWIVVVVSFAVVQMTLKKVVLPLEELAASADRIAAGDLTARARVGGDHEMARLSAAVNGMADELRAHARTDDLTGLPNFRAFRERIDVEIDRTSRYPSSFGILVLDLDRFKKYNDTFGHLAGNDALQSVAAVIRETIRAVDFPARYGGEEFAIILPEVDVESLAVIAERIRLNVERIPAPPNGSSLTISIGASVYPMDGREPEALFHAADERLYAAKHAGRNRVVMPAEMVTKSADG